MANTVIEPGAVMIEVKYAILALATMAGVKRAVDVACVAEYLVNVGVFV